jgi:amidase
MLGKLNQHDIADLAERVGWFSLTESETESYATLSTAILELLDQVGDVGLGQYQADDDAASGVDGPISSERHSGRRPRSGEDPLNAIVRWCGAQRVGATGVLDGLRVAVKDSVAVAGVPMTLGSSVIQGFVPSTDSVVAERILEAGGQIVAMTNMDSFAFSGGGDTSAYGGTLNPFDPERSAGGSSGGSAAGLYYPGVIDASIGCDQGGSIRLPAAWCGVLGLKPTHSLVPYTGIAGIDATFDHAGPMARSASMLARLLAAIAGPHPSDPRQRGVPPFDDAPLLEMANGSYGDVDGIRIGLLVEGFSNGDAVRSRTSKVVREYAERLAKTGVDVEEVSVPAHLTAGGIAFAGFMEGMAALLRGGGNGFHWSGRYSPEFALALATGLRSRGDELPPQIKLVCLLGEYLSRDYGGAVYAAAQNQRPLLRHDYDTPLQHFDALLMPTAPYPAYEHDPGLGITERVLRGFEPLGNCAPFDMTGHPAITLPAASVDGLPVGVMLVGRLWDDARLVDLAGRFERRFGWDEASGQSSSADRGPPAPPI